MRTAFPLVEMCAQCGDDTYLAFPSALPDAPDFGEYVCPSCGHVQKFVALVEGTQGGTDG